MWSGPCEGPWVSEWPEFLSAPFLCSFLGVVMMVQGSVNHRRLVARKKTFDPGNKWLAKMMLLTIHFFQSFIHELFIWYLSYATPCVQDIRDICGLLSPETDTWIYPAGLPLIFWDDGLVWILLTLFMDSSLWKSWDSLEKPIHY